MTQPMDAMENGMCPVFKGKMSNVKISLVGSWIMTGLTGWMVLVSLAGVIIDGRDGEMGVSYALSPRSGLDRGDVRGGALSREEKMVRGLIKRLKNPFWIVRIGAAWALGRIGPAAIESLTRHLDQERDPEVRETIQGILERLDYLDQSTPTPSVPAWSYEQVMEILCKGTKDEQYQATQRTVKLLKEEPRHKQAVMDLVKDVNEVMKLVNEDVNKAEGVRWRLVVALGTVERDEAVVEFLEGIASDRQEAKLVRKNAVLSLGFLGQERSIKVLEGIKNDPGLKSVVERAIHQIALAQGHEIRGVSFGRFSVAGLEALEVLEVASAQAVESTI